MRTATAMLLAWLAAAPAAAYTTLPGVTVSRSLEPLPARAGEQVTVRLRLDYAASASEPLRGLWLSDAVPAGLSAETVAVTGDGGSIDALEERQSGLLTCCELVRWVLETPPGWNENLPLAPGGALEVVYRLQVPADFSGGQLVFPGYSWVGMLPAQGAAGDHFGFADVPEQFPVEGGTTENQSPAVAARAEPTSGTAPLEVDFSATASDPDGQVVEYHWRFGDGQGCDQASCRHTFQQPGSYVATIEVRDDRGAGASDTVTVLVFEASGDGGEPDTKVLGGCACATRPAALPVPALLILLLCWRRRGRSRSS